MMRLRVLVLLVACWCGLAAPALADPPLWRLKRGDTEIVLFGSVHVLNEGVAWRTPALDAALAQADEVWFEIPIDPAARAQGAGAAMRRGRLPPRTRLTTLLPREGRALLARTAARLGLPMTQLERMRPWFAEAVISLADLQMRGARQAEGVEEQLSARAPATARLRAFETPEQQIGILAGQSTREQVSSLMETMRQIEEEPQTFGELQAAWAAGDVAWIEREALSPMRQKTPRLYKALVVDRNRRWASAIDRRLREGGRVVMIVGVGHLVGPESVPSLLRRKGYAVEGP